MNNTHFLAKSNAKTFYDRLGALSTDFGQLAQQAEAKNQALQKLLKSLEYNVGLTVRQQQSKAEKTVLADMLNQQIATVTQTVQAFVQQAQTHQHNTHFRDEFNDSVLVFIYGKVKAGKSSLGNFIGKHPLQTATPKFFKYDKAGQRQEQAKLEEIAENGFETKVTEATDTIQGFKINGLTWIDTPGLHSLTDINGDLAKKYVEAADLIFYITSSDSPARASDTAEIVELVGTKNKKVCVILSKSDSMEEDEVNGELVQVRTGKSAADRQLQENHTKTELTNALGANASLIDRIYSCSTLLGYDGLKGNETAWQQSNMEVIYHLMTQEAIINAKALKADIPKQRFNGLLNQTVGLTQRQPSAPLEELLAGLKELAESSETEQQKMRKSASAVYTRIRPKIAQTVRQQTEAFFAKFGDNAETAKQNMNTLNENLAAAIQPIVQDELLAAIRQAVRTFDDGLPMSLQLKQMPTFEEKFKEIAVRKNNAAGWGLFAGLAATLLTGGLAAGLLAGAAAAGMAADGNNASSRVKDGDNRDQVREKIIQSYEQELPKQIDQQLRQVADDYFGSIAQIAQHMNQHVNSFLGDAHGLRF